jgi:hypothetical protein
LLHQAACSRGRLSSRGRYSRSTRRRLPQAVTSFRVSRKSPAVHRKRKARRYLPGLRSRQRRRARTEAKRTPMERGAEMRLSGRRTWRS